MSRLLSRKVAKKWNITDTLSKSKGLSHSPSLRAIRNYNDLPIDRKSDGVDNPGFEDEYKYEYYTNPSYGDLPVGYDSKLEYDYLTVSTKSMKTSFSGDSENHSHTDNEMGSSVKLVTEKVERSCKTWCTHFSTIICTISIAAGLGTLYRLPQTTILRGGLPFLVVYAILTVIIGLPLLFLELGIGQLAQEGFIKSWRAVPFFKGVGYVKLLAGCLLSMYYPLYMGLAILYMIWIVRGPVPFTECASGVLITQNGYTVDVKNGQECIQDTFLKSPFDDAYYFSIYVALLFLIWVIVIILSIRRTKSYIRSLLVLFFPVLACYIALTTKSILMEAELGLLYTFFQNVDWSIMTNSDVWYFATIQVFFSTNVGFGSFITNAGIMYNKVNPLWTALGYVVVNLVFGTGSIIITHIVTSNTANFTTNASLSEVHLFTSLYDAVISSSNSDLKYWMIAAYLFFVSSGFISMATLTYTLLKAIYGHDGIRLKWWQTSIIFSFLGFMCSCALLLKSNFALVRLFDQYIVGNLILICVVLEVLAFITFYGTSKIQSDFEFMLGHILNKFWLVLWWVIPFLLTGILLWGLLTLYLNELFNTDPIWMYAGGWGVVLTAFVFILVVGIFVMCKHDGYTICDKLKASLEPSHNWGPKDPMLRYNWVQWNSQSQTGGRDFTLKRRGTKEYTKTIRKKAKKDALATGLQGAYTKNENSVTINNNVEEVANGNPRTSDQSTRYSATYYIGGEPTVTDRNVTSMAEYPVSPKHHHHHRHHHHHHQRNTFPVNVDDYRNEDNVVIRHSYPATSPFKVVDATGDENSEGYGTFRNKGPYIIDGDLGHVCHRKYDNEHEAVTEL